MVFLCEGGVRMIGKTKQMVYMSLLVAVGVILPMAFHMVGAGGSIFLPMHIPVFLAGIILGPWFGMIVGAVTPFLSSFLTGMPPMLPMLPIMFVELALYGLIIGYICHTKKLHIYIGLILSMVIGRIGVGLVVWVMVSFFNMTRLPANPVLFISGAIITGFPGIIIQLILIPLISARIFNYSKEEMKKYV